MVDPKLFTQVDLEQEIVPPLEVIPTGIDVETPELILYVDVMGKILPDLPTGLWMSDTMGNIFWMQ